jgi:hypothetical protein
MACCTRRSVERASWRTGVTAAVAATAWLYGVPLVFCIAAEEVVLTVWLHLMCVVLDPQR